MTILRVLLTLLSLLLLTAPTAARADDDDSAPDAVAVAETDADAVPDSDAAPEPQYTCFVTGAPWNQSPTRVEVIFTERGQLKRARFLSLAYFIAALAEFQTQGRPLSVRAINVLDYDSYGSGSERMIRINRERDADNVWFVLTSAKLRDTRPPYLVAFATEENADEFVRKHGGRKMDYAKVLTKVGEHLGGLRDPLPE